MIKNGRRSLPVALAFVAGQVLLACEPAPSHPGAFQGVIELDERVLGFETGGRLVAVDVQRGDIVEAGDLVASIDDTLARAARDARAAEANAASARVAVVRAGNRGEEVRAMAAELRAAQASEDLLSRNVVREKALVESGVVPPVTLEEAESRLATQRAHREAIAERLRGLRNGARKQEIESVEAQAEAADKAVDLESERVARYDLLATTAGTVLDVHCDPGEIVAPGTPVISLADTTHPYIDVFVPEGGLVGIRLGVSAKINVDGDAQSFAGHIEDVGRKTEFTPRYLFSERERPTLVVRVRVRVDDPTERLHAGVPAFVWIERQ